MGRPAKALFGFNRALGSNLTPSAMSIRARCAFAVLIAASTLFVGAGNVSARGCANTYTARRGDSWWSIASKSNVTLKQILTLNKASMRTVILIGDDVCVPAVSQPAVSQPAVSQLAARKPAARRPAASQVVTTYTRNEIETIIRDIWPDDLENRALKIAWRESNFRPEVINRQSRCCYGLFQIYYRWHTNWLPSVGVTSAEQLFDPVLNTRAAYKLYVRNGWGPWKLSTAG